MKKLLLLIVSAAILLSGCSAEKSDKSASSLSEFKPESKINNHVSVDDFGAVGDGTTDDYEAIQEALDYIYSNGGGTVYFTSGKTYLISKSLFIRDYTNIYAYGATIKAKGSIGLLVNQGDGEEPTGYSGHSHIMVEGGIWDCDAHSFEDGLGTNYGQNGISFTHCQDITIRDVTILNTAVYHAIELNACQNARIQDCNFLGFKLGTGNKEAIQLDVAQKNSGNKAWDGTLCNNVVITGCFTGPSERLPAHPVFVGSHATYEKNCYSNIIITNNIVNSDCGVYAYYWKDCIITGNIFNGVGDPVHQEKSSNLVISNNIHNNTVYPQQ